MRSLIFARGQFYEYPLGKSVVGAFHLRRLLKENEMIDWVERAKSSGVKVEEFI